MDFEIKNFIVSNILNYGFLALVVAVLMSIYFVPKIRELAQVKNLTDNPSARKSHSQGFLYWGGLLFIWLLALP